MRVTREFREDLVARLRIMAIAVTTLAVAVASCFWFVQLVQGAHYRDLAENNHLRELPVRAPRGLITDRQGRPLAENVPSYNLMIDRSRSRDLEASVAFASEILGRPAEELRDRLASFRKVPNFKPVAVAHRLSLRQVARIGVAALEYPEFEIDVEHQRLYRHGPQTGHVLGYLGQANARELERNPLLYSPGDWVGKRGVEEVYDGRLRGRDGRRVVVVDSRGKVLRESGHEAVRPGQSLTLTIDLELQQEAERQLRDRVGAVVALDPSNGDILAMYSSPAYNPNGFAGGLSKEAWVELLQAPHNPLQNRVLQNTHSPGSLFKIVMAAAGLAEGLIQENERVYCKGSTTLFNHRYHCWKREGHGSVDLHDAIKASCNVYFYHLGQKLGIERIARYARIFGLGAQTGIELKGEKEGLVPDPEWSLRTRSAPWYPGETVSVSIGQGALLVSPLQVARMLAAVANGGVLLRPRLTQGFNPPAGKPLGLDPSVIEIVHRGLKAVVEDVKGTAYWTARVPGLEAAGKTGTVQVVRRPAWIDPDSLPFEKRNHAWFASYAPADDPELVVVVFIEHGGAGSTAAAPVAKALYEKFFKSRLQAARSL